MVTKTGEDMKRETTYIKTNKGFSLIEIMVVLAIMGLLAAIVAPNVMNALSQGKEKKVRADFTQLETALKMYKMDNGFYPTSDQGLEALVTAPTGSPEPRSYPAEGYMPRLPQDPWKFDYVYLSPGNGRPYDIYTLGADGLEGGEEEAADVSIWDKAE